MFDGKPETIRRYIQEMMPEIYLEIIDYTLAKWIVDRLVLKGVCMSDIQVPEDGVDIREKRIILDIYGRRFVVEGDPLRLVPDPEEVAEAVKELVTCAEAVVPIIKPDAPLRWYKNDKVRDELKRAIARVNDLFY